MSESCSLWRARSLTRIKVAVRDMLTTHCVVEGVYKVLCLYTVTHRECRMRVCQQVSLSVSQVEISDFEKNSPRDTTR